MQAVTLFGSNTGDKQRIINQAISRLSSVGHIISGSSFYETVPWGFEADENFLNQITVFDTLCTPEDFLNFCLTTEKQLGRIRSTDGPRYASRPIDIDLLFCDDLILNTPELMLPHPRLHKRNFVLIPLAEIMPAFIHPQFNKNISQLLAECTDTLPVKRVYDSPRPE